MNRVVNLWARKRPGPQKSFKKMADISEIFAEYWQKTARPAEFWSLNGPAQLKFGPDRPGPICQA